MWKAEGAACVGRGVGPSGRGKGPAARRACGDHSEGHWRLRSEMRLSDGGQSRLDSGFENKWES